MGPANGKRRNGAGPDPLLALHGDQKLSDREVAWAITDEPERTIRLLQSSGRIMLGVHCGHLVDKNKRSLCPCVDALIGAISLRVPGSVFKGWFRRHRKESPDSRPHHDANTCQESGGRSQTLAPGAGQTSENVGGSRLNNQRLN